MQIPQAQEGAASASSGNSMRRKAEWLLISAMLVSTAMFVAAVPLHLRPSYQVDNAEGVILATAAHVNAGHSAYGDPHTLPVYLSPYGPLFYSAVAFITRQTGLSFLWPRALVLLATAVVAICIGLLIEKWTGRRVLAALCALVFLNSPIVQSWSAILRADMPALALSMLGLTIFVFVQRGWYWSIPFFSGAIFCKYSVLAAPVACFVWLIWVKDFRKAILLAAGIALISAGGILALQSATDGWFLFHMLRTHPDPFQLDQLAIMFKRLIATEWLVIAFALVFVLRGGVGQRLATRNSVTLSRLFLAVSFLVSISAGKLGANTNYLLELIAALTICAGLGYQHLAESEKVPRLAAIGIVSLATVMVTGSVMYVVPGFTVRRAALADCDRAYALLESHPGKNILAENAGAAVVTGKDPIVSDLFMYTQLTQHGTLSERPVLEQLRGREIPLVVMGEEFSFYDTKGSARWSSQMISAIRENYRAIGRFRCQDSNVILQPNPEPVIRKH